MPRGLHNWNYEEVTNFLRENKFFFFEQRKGSHEAWISGSGKVVEINFHPQKTFPPKTLKMIIIQSGIPEKVWRKWTKS